MTALALHQPTGGEFRRYGAAAVVIVLLHMALIAAAITWLGRPVPLGPVVPAIYIDLAPPASAPEVQMQDVEVGPQVEQSDAPPPEPPKPETLEQLPPTPVQPEPVIAAPPKVEPKAEPTPVKPQPVHEPVKKPAKKPPAPRTTAPQRAERVAPEAQSVSAGQNAAAARSNYKAMLYAHLVRFKVPAGGDTGTVHIRFTVARNGRLISSGLARSSGSPAVDRAALEMLQRAQPLPAFPADMPQNSEPYVVPVTYGAAR